MLETIQPIYKNWQSNTELLGYAIPKEKIEGGLTFILSDVDPHTKKPIPEYKQVVYSYNTYIVSFVMLTPLGESIIHTPDKYKAKIRYIKQIGLASADDSTTSPYPSSRPRSLEDNIKSY